MNKDDICTFSATYKKEIAKKNKHNMHNEEKLYN